MAGENCNRNKKVSKELLVEERPSFPDAFHFQIIISHFSCDESLKCVKLYSCLL